MDAIPVTSCDGNYVFTGTLCVLNDIVDAKAEYSCSKKYTLKGDKCELYELKDPKIQRN